MTRRVWWGWAAGIGALALAASATSLPNQFAYDDVYVIQREARLHTLAHWWHLFAESYWSRQWGGDGYRPLTILAFAAQWVVGHGSALVFHAVNVALYVALCIAVFRLLTAVLPSAPAWIASALFAVHPVHVEAVGNIVGQSELTVALLLTGAMCIYIYGRRQGPLPAWKQVLIAFMYVAAMLFKEHGITLVALVVLAEATVVHDTRPLRRRLVEMRPLLLGMVALALAFLWVRGLVLPDGVVGFQPFVVFQGLHLTGRDRILTMIGLSPEWLRLFYWPVHLATEYVPRSVPVAQGVEFWELPGLLLMLGTFGLFFASLRKQPVAAFAIGWVMITLSPVSNLVIPAGFLIAERTLLFPSVGAMILLGTVIPPAYGWLAARSREWVLWAVVCVLIVAAGWRSALRQRVWYDSDVLFAQAVKDHPDSYRAHYMRGAWLMNQHRFSDGEAEYHKGMELFPYDPFMALSLAENYRMWGICKPAINLYRWAIGLDSSILTARRHLATCLLQEKQFGAAKKAAVDAVAHGAWVIEMHRVLVASDSAEKHMQPHATAVPPTGDSPDSLQNTQKISASSTTVHKVSHLRPTSYKNRRRLVPSLP